MRGDRRADPFLRGDGHGVALSVFLLVTVAHLAEHLVQAVQYWGLGMEARHAHGLLGALVPGLAGAEALHWTYNAVVLLGFLILGGAMQGRARRFWIVGTVLQGWHFLEHCVLVSQPLLGWTLGSGPQPQSLLQAFGAPRLELHLVYNVMVMLPLLFAVALHRAPPAAESVVTDCRCALRRLAKGSPRDRALVGALRTTIPAGRRATASRPAPLPARPVGRSGRSGSP